MKWNRKSLLYGAMLLTITQIFSQVIAFIFRVVLSRLIGAEGMGLYQLIMPVYSVALSLALYGLTVAVQRLSAAYSAKGNQLAVRQVVRLALWLFFLLLGLISIFVVPFSDWISVTLLGDARTRLGMILLLPCVFFTGIENIMKNYFYGVQEVRPPAITEVVEQLLRTGCVLTLLVVLQPAYKEWSVGVIVIGMVLCEIVSATMLSVFYLRHMAKIPKQGYRLSDRHLLHEMVTIAAPVSLATLAANLLGSINTIIIPGRLMLSGLGQSESLSAYGVALGMTLPLTTLPSVFVVPLSLTMLPRIAHSIALHNHVEVQRQVERTLRLAAALVLPACLLLIPLGPSITQALFSDKNAGQFVEILAVAEIFACFQYLMNSLLNGMGMQKRAAFNILLTDAIQLIATWYVVAVPQWRLAGFVVVFLCTTALGGILNVYAVIRGAKVALSLDKWLLKPLLSSLVAMGAAYAALDWFSRWGLSGLQAALVGLLCGVGGYCLCYFVAARPPKTA